MGTAYSIGSINIDGTSYTLAACAISGGRRLAQIQYPRRDKGVNFDNRSKARTFQCIVSVKGTSIATYQANLRAFLAALNTGSEMTLYLYDSTRYYNVAISDISDPVQNDTPFRSLITFSATAADPFWYHDTTPNSPNNQTPGINTFLWTITTQGNAYVEPTFTITGAFSDFTLTNTTTGEYFAYAVALGGGAVLVINVAARTITLNGTATFANCSGDTSSAGFPVLAAGANNMQFDTTSQGGTVVTTWTDRDWGGH